MKNTCIDKIPPSPYHEVRLNKLQGGNRGSGNTHHQRTGNYPKTDIMYILCKFSIFGRLQRQPGKRVSTLQTCKDTFPVFPDWS